MRSRTGPEAEISLRRRFFNLRTLISFALGIAFIIFLLFRLEVDLAATWQKIRGSHPLFYFLAFVAFYATFPLRGWRWHRLLENAGVGSGLSSRQLTPMVYLSFFVNCILPGRLGDAYRAYLLREEGGVGFTPSLGTIMAERALDAAIVFLLLAGAGFALWGRGVPLPLLGLGLGMALLLIFALLAIKGLGTVLGRLLPSPLRRLFPSFRQGALGSLRHLPLLSGQGLAIWLLEGARLYLVSLALDIPLHPLLILFAAQAHGLLSAIPFTPGGVGLAESGLAGLLMLALPKEEAWLLALVDRSISYLSIILFGAILLLVREVRWRRG